MVQLRVSKSKRFNEIFHILLEHNFPGILRELATYQPAVDASEGGPIVVDGAATRPTLPYRLRRMMEDLGPTFIKIGQLLGTRPDLIPAEFVEEFKKFYDQTTPTPFPEVRKVVEEEMGRPLEVAFKTFDSVPIASASIAQVHRATLNTGERVAVKVQHPGIDERMRTDFEILKGIVAFTEKVFAASQVWQPVKHLEELRHMLNKELDFRNELGTQQQVETNFRDMPEVKIPHVHEALSDRRVLVMEFVGGIKFRGRQQPELAQMNRKNLARIITVAMGKQIFIDRLFHADPSPGNLLIINDGQICLLDFGAVGQVTKRRAKNILDLIQALRGDNLEETARVIVEMCEQHKEYDPKQFLTDLERILEYYETQHASPADPVLLQKLIDLAETHGMLLPADFMLITRALYQFEGMCKELDPEYDLVAVLSPYLQQMMRERLFNPEIQVENLSSAAQELGRFVARLPAHLEKLMVKAERGELSTQVELKGLEEYKRHRTSLVVFAGFTAIVAALVVGVAVGYAWRGAEGFSVALFVGVVALLVWGLGAILLTAGAGLRR